MPLVGANVLVLSIERGACTDSGGEFSISRIPAGSYRLAVRHIGYEPVTKDVRILPEQTTKVRFVMREAVLESQPIVVTGIPVASDPMSTPQDVSYIGGREKIRLQAASLGETVASLPGIYSISSGSAAGKPVIRGHTGERIRVLIGGVAQEYHQYGERHGPNVDPFSYDRVEITKGVASLLYGSDALGGAINLIPYRFRVGTTDRLAFEGSVVGGYRTNNRECVAGLKFSGSSRDLGFTGSLTRRQSGDFRTPDTPAFAQTGRRGDPKFTGRVPNTDYEQMNGSLAFGYLTPAGIVSASYDHYSNENNFLLPTGSPIGLRLRNQTVSANGNLPFGRFIVKPKFSYQRNHRQATRSGSPRDMLPDSANVDLVLDVYTGRFEAENVETFGLCGSLGAEAKYYDHKNVGRVPLQPTGHFTNLAVFGFEEWKAGGFTLDLGVRVDRRLQRFLACTDNPLLTQDDEREYTSVSGALGASLRMSSVLTAAGSIARGFRTPSFYNMYVYGYHGGVFAFQIGDPDLRSETSVDLTASLRLHSERTEADGTVFQNRISNYIFLYSAPHHPLAPSPDKGPFVFAHDQANALLTGLELSLRLNPVDWLLIDGSHTQLATEFLSGPHKGAELPLMPASMTRAEIRFVLPDMSLLQSPYLLVAMERVGAKSAAGVYEPFGQFDDGIGPDIPFGVASTGAYSLLDVGIGFDVLVSGSPVNVDIEISNLLDRVHRDFLESYVRKLWMRVILGR